MTTLLAETDAKLGRPEDVSRFVDTLFDGLKQQLDTGELSELFEFAIVEHTDFAEQTTRGFIIRMLNQEKRHDDFVTARKNVTPHPFGAFTMALCGDPENFPQNWDLTLNMRMDRVQMKVTFTPKFSSLQQIILVVTCAPSLEHCYVFELATRHPKTDWSTFAAEGTEITRRWYKRGWRDDVGDLVHAIAERLKETVQQHLAAVADRLTK
ncbi:hypothetical protein [Defluviicoccus vanus]|uniref:hypothetical protein n=1 Tax=Defluviicoccus vanus TaxID=111831 RepID=UPI001CBA6144|nr:hypothetical protein [Defluviicoccus vanus]